MNSIHLNDIQSALAWAKVQRIRDEEGVRDLEIAASLMTANLPWCLAKSLSDEAMSLWMDWYETTPDTPCIAICSTSQGDDQCKGCGRTFDEVIDWLGYSPVQKRATWQRIESEGTAWRFTSYKGRVRS